MENKDFLTQKERIQCKELIDNIENFLYAIKSEIVDNEKPSLNYLGEKMNGLLNDINYLSKII